MRNLQTSSLPPLTLRIKLIHVLNRIHEENRILADSDFGFLQIFHLECDLCVLTDCIRVIKLRL